MNTSINQEILSALATPQEDFSEGAKKLLEKLGYHSNRTLAGQSGLVADFIDLTADTGTAGTASEQALRKNTESIKVIFQITNDEIIGSGDKDFDSGNTKSFVFMAVELKKRSYLRGEYVALTREINKRLSQATVVLFKTAANLFTLAFVNRRPHKQNPDRAVLGNVSLIREINLADPHSAHLKILSELTLEKQLEWMDGHNKQRNFDGLLEAWLDALSTEELNRQFYRDLFNWFKRAVNEAKFPTNQKKTLGSEEHVIRLITRLLFVWFIKEKGLIASDLFNENRIRNLLQDYDRNSGDSYYRAVLQNLFFATLNTEIKKRGFSKKSNSTHRNFSCYRYKDEMSNPDKLLALFKRTPFINGGLFDCLDSEEATSQGGYRIDCFTDKPEHRSEYSIPNCLFFDDDGLISLFNHYKFTVEENTPAEQEVALDPELLGSVFEKLLAAYNPETRDDARKKTGSYYTPRLIVDYMVEESLVEALVRKSPPADDDDEFWRARLRYLLDYNDAGELFNEDETNRLVRAIAEIKVLDPAVGSGAFPMGILHKLTLALRRLDPQNHLWKKLQKERAQTRASDAFNTSDKKERDTELKEISKNFERYRDSDFGRKLYLIQNSIFGVDIQPVACQIAKLRFFISLTIEQKHTKESSTNYGIKPLPNLETRFVVADTLLSLGQTASLGLEKNDEKIARLEQELKINRENHFHATERKQKLKYQKENKNLRESLAEELERVVGMSHSDAEKISKWDPYDQNAVANWFDPAMMFGVTEGFDIVIGNPPYISLKKERKKATLYAEALFGTFVGGGDIYQLFYEKGCQLLVSRRGLLSYITSNSWLRAKYGKTTRRYFSEQHTPLQLLEVGKDIFENAVVDTNILIVMEGRHNQPCKAADMDKLPTCNFPPKSQHWTNLCLGGDRAWSILSPEEQAIKAKIEQIGKPLNEWDIRINYGIKTGYNEAFIIDNQTKERLIAEDKKSADIIKPVLRGRDIRRYQTDWERRWLIATFPSLHLDIDNYPAIKKWLQNFLPKLHQSGESISKDEKQSLMKKFTSLDLNFREQDLNKCRKRTSHAWFELQDTCNYHEEFKKEKIVWIELVNQGRFTYDNEGIYCEATTFILTGGNIKYLCAILNSKAIYWFLSQIAPTSGLGTLRWKKVYVEMIPIPAISESAQQPFTELVDQILIAKTDPSETHCDTLEARLNQLVYQLYGLTTEQAKIIESIQWT